VVVLGGLWDLGGLWAFWAVCGLFWWFVGVFSLGLLGVTGLGGLWAFRAWQTF